MNKLFLCGAGILLLAACVHTDGARSDCPTVSSVHEMPFRGARSDDEAYNRLRFDDACETVLRNSLTSLKPMPDPRQMPPDPRLVGGDIALFLLLERYQVDFSQLLPEELVAEWEKRGMTVYFDHVAAYENRLLLIERLNTLISGN